MTVRPGWVYVMRREDGIRKLGCTVNLPRRRSLLKSVYGPLVTERTWQMSELAANWVETTVHGNLKEHRHQEGWALELYALSLRRLVMEVNRAKDWVLENLCDDLMTLDWSDGWKRDRAQCIERKIREEQERDRIYAEYIDIINKRRGSRSER